MMRGVAMLSVLAMIAACTQVQQVERSSEVQPALADTAAQARAITYQYPDVTSSGSSPRITVLRGATCQLGNQSAARTNAFTVGAGEYANVFMDEFRRAGYRALDPVAPGAADSPGIPVDIRIVSEMTNVRGNVCLPAADAGNIYDGKGEVSMAVRWQVYSVSRKAVVHTSTHQGYAKIDDVIPTPTRDLLRTAFARSIHGLLADEGFKAAMRGQ